jgi:ribosomal protein S18 acetylase RimI-like enzyme
MNTNIERIHEPADAKWCASLMASCEPWITLGRTYEESLQIIGDASKEVYVCRQKEELSGFIILNLNGALIGYVQTICVAPHWRRQGIGTALLRFAENRIFKESPNVFLCVSSFNGEAQKLYQREGYQTIGQLTDYFVEGHSEILMRKTQGPIRGVRKRS